MMHSLNSKRGSLRAENARTTNTRKKSSARKKNHGASRKTNRAGLVARFKIIGLLKVLACASALGIVGFAISTLDLQTKWREFYQRPIEQLNIQGKFIYVSHADLQQILTGVLDETFFAVDLLAIKNLVESHPWVDNASVSKVWPGTVSVNVVEQQPIARWGHTGFLNMRGDVIKIEDNAKLQALPLLSGDDRFAAEVMQYYLRMGKALSQVDIGLESLELDATRAWALTIDGNKKIKLGRDRIWEKIQFLTTAKKTVLAESFEQVAQIDLRYHNGLAVSWKQTAEAALVNN